MIIFPLKFNVGRSNYSDLLTLWIVCAKKYLFFVFIFFSFCLSLKICFLLVVVYSDFYFIGFSWFLFLFFSFFTLFVCRWLNSTDKFKWLTWNNTLLYRFVFFFIFLILFLLFLFYTHQIQYRIELKRNEQNNKKNMWI